MIWATFWIISRYTLKTPLMRIALTLVFTVISLSIYSQITFQKSYGTLTGVEYSLCAVPVSTGGYVVALNSDSITGSMDMALLRTDANGNELWRQYYGSSGWDIGTDVIETNDGGFALCGGWNGLGSDSATLIKTDANGNLQWQQTFLPQPGRAVAQDLIQLSDGSIIVCGFTGASTTPNGFIVKFSSAGTQQWQKVYGGSSNDEFMAIEDVNGNGFVLAGRTSGATTGRDLWLVGTDANGDTLWTRAFGTGIDEDGYDVVCTQDGGFAIVGEEYVSGGDVLLVKTNSTGAQQWIQSYDGGGWEMGRSLVETWDGGFALAGRKESPSNNNHMWLIRTDAGGVFMWDRTYPMMYMSDGYNIEYCSDGGFLIAGSWSNTSGDWGQAYVVKTENAGWVSVEENLSSAPDFLFAQDVNSQTITFTFAIALSGRRVRIVDAEGRLVCDEAADENVFTVSTSALSAGVYVYSTYSATGLMRSGKFVQL